MKCLLLIAILSLAACDDQPKQRVEQLLPAERVAPAIQPIKRVKLTIKNVMHMTHTPKDGTTPQQIAQAALEMLRETNPQ